MEHLHTLDIEQLVDILSTQTALYVQMHAEGASQAEFQRCKLLIHAVQDEISSRKENKSQILQEEMGNS